MKHLRHAAIFLTAFALAGCRFEVAPDSFDLSADVGQAITESIEVRNTGDELVEFSLALDGAPLTLSETAGVLQAGEVLDIEISAECSSPGERRTDISVTGRTGNKAATVHVPFVLRCQNETGTHLVSLELFQGPPIYKKDYRAGTETEQVNLHRPENGAEPVPEYQWMQRVNDGSGDTFYPSKDDAWSPDNEGLVTALWRRRAAVAVTAFHMDESPAPEFAASVDDSELPILVQETKRAVDGFETVTVFGISRDRYQRGAVLDVSVESDDGSLTDRLALFGETVEPLLVTWIPIDVPEFPAPTIDAEFYMEGTVSWLPIAEYTTGIGPTMEYVENGNEVPRNPYDIFEAARQLREHHALHACDRNEIYIGYPDNHGMFNAEGSSGSRGVALGETIIGSMIIYYEDEEVLPLDIHRAAMLNAHEVGHVFGQAHVPGCSIAGRTTVDYPYEDSKIGPTRGWDWISTQFVERDEHLVLGPAHIRTYPVHDFMTACGGQWIVSDFAYQLMALHQQSSEAVSASACEAPGAVRGAGDKAGVSVAVAKSAPAGTAPRSIAIAGRLSDDGIASITMVESTGNPPWPAPAAGAFTLELLDGGGTVLHREPVLVAHAGHGHGEALWSARVPYFQDGATALLRGSSMDVLASFDLRADATAESGR